MKQVVRLLNSAWTSRLSPWVAISLILAILGGTVYWGTLHLREKIREQIISRDGEILNAVAIMQYFSDDQEEDMPGFSKDPLAQMDVALKASRLPHKGVLGVRLFDVNGRFIDAFPGYVTEGKLDTNDLARARQFQPACHYYAAGRLDDLTAPEREPLEPGKAGNPSVTTPLVAVVIPLHRQSDPHLLGIAQFILEGQGIATEFAALDRNLFIQASWVFLTGSMIIAATLGWAFNRLQTSNQQLAERTATLLRANHELTLAAKTSAIGAVAAHLIHGLKNPLFGLQNFMSTVELSQPDSLGSDWQVAMSTTHRMRSLVSEVVRVLQEEDVDSSYEISLAELLELISAKVKPAAAGAGVAFTGDVNGVGALTNSDANLILLILDNLIQNAIQATPRGRSVYLTLSVQKNDLTCQVTDEGPGVPEEFRQSLFGPCRSTKPGGSGIGLAISKQLAAHLAADLDLTQSSLEGTTFTLRLPARILRHAEPVSARANS